MNCLEFRRQLLIEPRQQECGYLDHARACPTCGREYQRALRFEKHLYEALVADAPPGIDSRILLTQQMAQRESRARHWRPLQAAAGILLAFGIVLFVEHLGSDSERVERLRGDVLAHIEGEPESLLETSDSGDDHLQSLLASFGLKQLASLGEIIYAGVCDIGKRKGIHIVVRGKTQPVTLILLPGERIKVPARILTASYEGTMVPTSYGSMAVVGDPSEPVAPVLKQVHSAIAIGI